MLVVGHPCRCMSSGAEQYIELWAAARPCWASVLQAASCGLIGGRGAGVLGFLKCTTRCAIVFQEGTERGRAPRRELQCIEGATVESTNTRSWMLPIVAPRGRRQGQRSCKRRRRQRARDAGRRRCGVPDASGCLLWSYRALFMRELGVREDRTARVLR